MYLLAKNRSFARPPINDPVSYTHLSQLIQDLIAKTYQTVQDGYHRTTLIITHDKDLLYRLRPRVVMLQEGMVVFDGSYPSFAQSESPSIHPYFELMPAFNDSLH